MTHAIRTALFPILVVLASSCVYPATEALVVLDTDAPRGRALTIVATARSGTATTGAVSPGQQVRLAGRGGDRDILPSSFGLTPGDSPRNGPVSLVIEMEVAAGADGMPPLRLRRIARFRFSERVTTLVRVFLPISCASPSTGCRDSGECTVSTRCEEQGLTCGDNGTCVSPDIIPVPYDGGSELFSDDRGPMPEDGSDARLDVPLVDAGSDAMDALADEDSETLDVFDVPADRIVDGRTDAISEVIDATGIDANDASLDASMDSSDGCPSTGCVPSCPAGWHDCGGVCVSNDTVNSCGTACVPCSPPLDSVATCDGAACGFTCSVGYALSGGTCVAVGPVPPPRPIAPLSTSTASSRQPAFRWSLPPGADGARIEICADRACITTIATFDATGTSAAPSSPLPTGVVFWRLYGRSAGVLGTAPSATWQVVVGARSATADRSAGSSFDANGDGFADLVIGAPGPSSAAGTVRVYHGGAAGVVATPSATLSGAVDGDAFGVSVASAGDVNGDGFADLVVGSSGALGASGAAYVFAGSASGLIVEPATVVAGAGGDRSGATVASAGDVNGDGYADVLVGAPTANGGAGVVRLYLGSASGLQTTAAATLRGMDATANFGSALSTAGDLTGDGRSEIAVGADGVSTARGAVYVYNGTAAGVAPTPGVVLNGPGANAHFGAAVSGGGDFNGDGRPDVAIGAPGVLGRGGVYAYLGGSSGLSSTAATALYSSIDGSGFGRAVSAVGDANGDGYADLAVGAADANAEAGTVSVFLGLATGVSLMPAVILPGGTTGGRFGANVALVADTNGDGRSDLAVAAERDALGVGSVSLYAGTVAGVSASPSSVFTGDAVSAFGASIAAADDAPPPFLFASRDRRPFPIQLGVLIARVY